MYMRKMHVRKTKFKTAQIIALGFAAIILLGALLLSLPIAWAPGHQIKFIDALFTSTTSICVTGLVTESTYAAWSGFGHVVILFLIQLGGFGVITCGTLVVLAMGKRVSIRNRRLIQESYNLDTLKGLIALVRKIVLGTLLVEGVGMVFYSFQFVPEFGIQRGLQISLFNSVSAFCNAGMDIIGDNNLANYAGSPLVNITTMALIVLGGIGYLVWWDLIKCAKRLFRREMGFRQAVRALELNTKIAVTATVILIFGGAFLILILEYRNPGTLGNMPFWEKCMAAVFQSVTCRTAGFFTIPQENLQEASAMVCMILMFIGGSPLGTAGGVKTTTMAALLLTGSSFFKGKEDTEVFNRRIPENNIRTAWVVLMLGLAVVLTSTIGLAIATEGMEEGAYLINIMYEVTSAGATVGLSRGLTPLLPAAGKLIIILTMYIGRIGPTTLATALTIHGEKKPSGMHLPDQKIFIG